MCCRSWQPITVTNQDAEVKKSTHFNPAVARMNARIGNARAVLSWLRTKSESRSRCHGSGSFPSHRIALRRLAFAGTEFARMLFAPPAVLLEPRPNIVQAVPSAPAVTMDFYPLDH